VAEDDCGIDWVTLVAQRLPPKAGKWDTPLVAAGGAKEGIRWQSIEATSERVRNRLEYQWELGALGVEAGDVIEFHLLAKDNFRLGERQHDPVASSKLRITVISPEDMLARVTGELPARKAVASNLRTGEARAKAETTELAEAVKDKPRLDAADRAAIERLAQQQSSTAAATKALAGSLQQSIDKMDENRLEAKDVKSLLEEVKAALERTSEEPMKDAAKDLADADAPDKPAEARNASLASAAKNQQAAVDGLDRVMARLESVGSLQSSIADLKGILDSQKNNRKANAEVSKRNLGKTPEQMSPEDRKKLEDISGEQSKIADRTERAIGQLDKRSKEMSKSDPSASKSMEEASRKGQESKVTQNQRRAAEQTKQNQQAGAQKAQQQVELGLEQMLAELNEAEKRELARLREKLAEMDEQVAILVRRQAGHNLDNVFSQGPDKVKGMTDAIITALQKQAQRSPEDRRPPPAGGLSPAQELTERNTRDLAKTADDKPETQPAATALSKAAGKMERAIIALRATKLAEAYDPSQVEALAALTDAAKTIKEEKDKADKKAEDEKKDAIRQRYERVREQQVAINGDTVKVEKSRDERGTISRAETVTVRRLPDAQVKAAEEIAKIGEDLSSLESVVYVWANADIKATMEAIKTDLAALKTGAPTQAEQARVVAQLDVMIKNLVERSQQDKFEKAGGDGEGGQGGGGGAKMPAEAELRLLKALQEVINANTIKLAARKDARDEHVGLGSRQGELRVLLGTLLEKAGGNMKLGPEPDNKNALPEEAAAGQVEDAELQDMLLGEGAAEKKIEQDFKLVGTRMSRVRQRLTIDTDAGQITQEIEKRILKDLDTLIETAAKNASQSAQSKPGKSGQQQKAQDDAQKAANEGKNKGGQQQAKSADGATESHAAGAGSTAETPKDIKGSEAEWGTLFARDRAAVIESLSETPIEQYQKLIEDYREALAKTKTRSK
jgi:hypothetical protein